MKLRKAIGTAISLDAKLAIYEEMNGNMRWAWVGSANDIPQQYLDREFEPIAKATFNDELIINLK